MNFFNFLSVLLFLFFISSKLIGQTINPNVGYWDISNGISQSTTPHNVGVGTLNPDGKMEIQYQPCDFSQNGLIITSLNCPLNNQVINYNPIPTDGLIAVGQGEPETPYVPVLLSFSPAFTITTKLIPLKDDNSKPLFWVRDENKPYNNVPGSPTFTSYNTKFIILPNGNIGVNTNNPRGTFDVVQFNTGYNNFPTAVFGKIVSGTQTELMGGENNNISSGVYGYRTSQIMIYNKLAEKMFNRTVVNGDQGILFTDGKNMDGSNQNGCLVIAPWASDYTNSTSVIGGIRINNIGNVDIAGELKCTKLIINAKWWSDFVFQKNYQLLPLDSLRIHVLTHGYLPGMPSEKEILANGINTADMFALHQQKIEELTLYILKQNELLNELKVKLNSIKN
jgi:hypothetical protein